MYKEIKNTLSYTFAEEIFESGNISGTEGCRLLILNYLHYTTGIVLLHKNYNNVKPSA